ncbi:hypothetical protein [Jeotgalicoccus sp. ATCC 8456]|uniref:hypothetical protein n=1 Tax=Jeotgalicoccus sp. ATCC 8456 TaxID=946435 RepID=UPI0018E62D53|nr:hypothetical protein [Jeotgalicoccus sp. ATCC 8456]QQD84308.1 hypothetical protein JEM45_06555 [Jeotgalicoccus sp. ATCC 8456]
MNQSRNVIYYTTAQVTEMVELSDQNVRKYVRLLEDRNYEVAKDEYNRRLFSKKDVSILQEMIRIAKSPGNTLDSAADEIIENLNSFDEDSSEETNEVSNMSNHDISRMFSLVLEKLDEIQNENKALKTNINTLVQRLEEYDRAALEYTAFEEDGVLSTADELESETVPEDGTETTVSEEVTEEPAALTETIKTEAPGVEEVDDSTIEQEVNVTEEAEDTRTSTEEVSKTESEATEPKENHISEEAPPEPSTDDTIDWPKTSVDMSQSNEEKETQPENLNYGDSVEKQIEEPKKGFFGKLASIFKG